MTVIAQEHCDCGGGDDEIAQPAERIGNLPKDEIAEDGRENNLAIIIDGNFSGGGIGICGGDGELSACRCQACKQKRAKLCRCHGMIAEEEIGQGANAGKGGEKEHDERPFYPLHAQGTHIGIGNAGTQAAQKTNQGGKARKIGGVRLNDEQCAEECRCHTKPLKEIDSFL